LRFSFLADATDTGGGYSIIEVQAWPGMGPPPHIHSEDEAFYILDGAWTFGAQVQRRAVGGGGDRAR
jgi:quercetin dioxygenase-like cupin family protein